MPIPALTPEGFLPEGLYDCTLPEIEERFGQFQRSDLRCRLFERLAEYVSEVRRTGCAVAVIVNGSFVTNKAEPNDIDLILVLRRGHDYAATLRPFEYNVLSRSDVRRRFPFDLLVGEDGGLDLERHVRLFGRIRERDDTRKGILRVWL